MGPVLDDESHMMEFIVFATIFTVIVLLTGGPSNWL